MCFSPAFCRLHVSQLLLSTVHCSNYVSLFHDPCNSQCYSCYLLSLGKPSPLYWQMRSTFDEALAPGTIRNRQAQATVYVKFMLAYGFNWMAPTINQLAMFCQFLANTYPSPATIKNYVSGARTWVYLRQGDTTAFQAREVGWMFKSIAEASTHESVQAPPLIPTDIRIICRYLEANRQLPLAIKPCLLIAYSAFLRGSNAVSPLIQQWGGPHTLMVSDIITTENGLLIHINSTKTKRTGGPIGITIFPSGDPLTCPVEAWLQYKATINPCPLGPAFMVDIHTPLTTTPVVEAIRKGLNAVGHKKAHMFSFHSLRRGAAQAAASQGASTELLMQHGTWSSRRGLAAYVKPDARSVSRLIAKTLAQ